MLFLKRVAELVNAPAEGVVDHVISVFGNVDDGNDVVFPGAMAKTIQESGPLGADRIRATWQHDLWEPIGRPLEMREVGVQDLPQAILGRAPGATGGMFVKTKISMTTRGRDAYTLLQDEVLREWSIGYLPVKSEWLEGDLRGLREVKLVEYGLVTLAMNAGALTTDVKSVVTYQDLPLGDEGADWDAEAAEARVREWAGGGEDLRQMDWEKYRQAFVLWDAADPENVRSYKLPVGDIVEGDLVAMPRGVFAAAAAIQGARTPVHEFDDGDIEGAKRHLSRYYERLERVAPWDREESSIVPVLVEMVLSKGRATMPVGVARFVQELALLEAPGAQGAWLGQVERFAAAWAEGARAWLGQETGHNVKMETGHNANVGRRKEGRVLSGTNVKLVRNAVTQMQEAVQALEDLLAAAEPGGPEMASALTARAVLKRRMAMVLADLDIIESGGRRAPTGGVW